MTLEEAIRETRGILRDHAATKVTDGILAQWLDQGQADVAALTLCYQRLATTTTLFRAGKRLYGVSTDLGLTDYLGTLSFLLSGSPLLLWTPTMIGLPDTESAEGGTPRYYYDFADELAFLPYPDTTFLLSAYSLTLLYAASAPAWTAGTASILPAGFAQLPLLFASSQVLWTQRRWREAIQIFERYLGGLQAYSLVTLAQGTTGQTPQRVPVRTEREDEPHIIRLLQQTRRGQRR